MNKWTTQVSNDTCLYSLFCTPCAFGDNMKKVQQGTSCYKHCLLYSLSYIIGTISGIVWATALPVPAQATQGVINFCTWCNVGLYAAANRRKLREKYDLPEYPCNDCLMHTVCSPCAVMQESAMIEEYEKNIIDLDYYYDAPEPIIMSKK